MTRSCPVVLATQAYVPASLIETIGMVNIPRSRSMWCLEEPWKYQNVKVYFFKVKNPFCYKLILPDTSGEYQGSKNNM